ncbi:MULTISPECIES: phage tail protein [unclassified Paracoccus (in: a-proteobacteria)]|uniref:phage tail protein n=1 Tax=unclassified Paracoccus (in: a-proteobacteria) TaxID=2688777 RepID=UPI0012B20EDF|nr:MULTISPECIES: phage tail protein [unclassified Paracoccus (in: a-proteobacteria)]UXU74374.1 phage tail protein [Paracoccus sp. SMMA_5]UXU80264.1 phage tail protein [Paracoccus sp. SMMA_5_TC]
MPELGLSLVMMALGALRFGVNRANYQQFTRAAAWRWQAQDRVGRRPALQFLGPGTDEISLEGVIYPHFKGGLRQVELMRLLADQGQPLILVDGLGWVWDRWVIAAVEERKSLFMADGAPRKIEFTVNLLAYGADAA